MFESAELGHKIDKKTFKAEVPKLRAELLDVQYDMLQKKEFPVVILISGVDGSGKGETINLLYSWMDPRHISTLAFSTPSDEEVSRPFMWRYWRALPPKGKVGIFAGSWYSQPITDRINGDMRRSSLDEYLDDINRFEAMLVNEGALVLKFWFHLSKDGQKQRIKALEKDPRTAWRVTKESYDRLKTYDRLQQVAGHVLRVSNTAHAPWIIVEGTDDEYRSLTVGRIVLDAMKRRLSQDGLQRVPVAPPIVHPIDNKNVLSELDLKQKLTKKDYETQLAKYQARLSELVRDPRFVGKRSLVLVFEGSDAAGKGGSIRRVAASMDARQYQIIPIAAPTEEERAQPYLWRFWRNLPRTGRAAIFDRSWYGRVLVERVEGFCTEADWLRAYAEINDFEHQLVDSGAIVVKFWLQISADEQLRRFKERQATEFKRFKITDEDWRNREKWDDYVAAVCDMVDRTSTGLAPWTLVEANDKNFARVKVLKTLCERLESALKDDGKYTEKMSDTPYDVHFVSWFRAVTPYINAFRGKTFVIAFGGKAVASEFAKTLAYDVNLLASLGIRLVLVHGARPQIEEELREKNLESIYHRGYRVTDAAALDCVLDAVGSVYLEIQAMLSQGLPNTPMANSRIRVIGGNFITGQPIGVLDGIDMHYAGKVRKVDADGINAQLGLGNIVLLNCEGPSPTGEIFNLQMEEAAEAVAVAIRADKLVFLTDSNGVTDKDGTLLDAMTADEASQLLRDAGWLSADIHRYLPCAVRASRTGVGRVHLIGFEQDGALLRELFTHDGVGTVVTRESLENIREAKPDDIAALIALIEPMEQEGILVHRPRELLERELELFSIMLHDGIIVGCAALYQHSETEAELACLAVSQEHREWGYGEQLMIRIEQRARKSGIKRLFVLTTRTEHWFVERGFKVGSVDDLPANKRDMYNYQRRSKVLFKTL